MTTHVLARLGGRLNPTLVIGLLCLATLGCLTAAVVQLLAAPGPALLATVVAGGLVWLWRAAPRVVVPLPALGCLVAAVLVWPWFALPGLVWLVLRAGGDRR